MAVGETMDCRRGDDIRALSRGKAGTLAMTAFGFVVLFHLLRCVEESEAMICNAFQCLTLSLARLKYRMWTNCRGTVLNGSRVVFGEYSSKLIYL